MIRVNLIEGAQKSGRGGSKITADMLAPATGQSPQTWGVLILLGALVVLGLHYFWLQHQASDIAAGMAKAQSEASRLQAVRHDFELNTQKKSTLEARIKVINDLRQGQFTQIQLLRNLDESVLGAGPVWLSDLKESEDTLEINGYAQSIAAVAQFMKTMQATGYFSAVHFKKATQNNSSKAPGVPRFLFNLKATMGSSGAREQGKVS